MIPPRKVELRLEGRTVVCFLQTRLHDSGDGMLQSIDLLLTDGVRGWKGYVDVAMLQDSARSRGCAQEEQVSDYVGVAHRFLSEEVQSLSCKASFIQQEETTFEWVCTKEVDGFRVNYAGELALRRETGVFEAMRKEALDNVRALTSEIHARHRSIARCTHLLEVNQAVEGRLDAAMLDLNRLPGRFLALLREKHDEISKLNKDVARLKEQIERGDGGGDSDHGSEGEVDSGGLELESTNAHAQGKGPPTLQDVLGDDELDDLNSFR